jgi:hypothetical protein
VLFAALAKLYPQVVVLDRTGATGAAGGATYFSSAQGRMSESHFVNSHSVILF